LIVGGGACALVFLDTTSLGTGSFDIEGNGLIFIVMASIWGFSMVMSLINIHAENNWHKAMLNYAAIKMVEDPDTLYSNDPNGLEEEVAVEEETMLMNDQDWSW